MFTFLKKPELVKTIINTKSEPEMTESEIIEQIHNEFDAVQENLLQQAKAIINNYNEATGNKAERMKKLGFTSSDIVVNHEKQKEKLIKSKEEAERIEYYKFTYPFQKFLTEKELNRICKKYNLIYAPVFAYKGDVPEKNLLDIEQAKPLADKDKEDTVYGIEIKKYRENISDYTKKAIANLRLTRKEIEAYNYSITEVRLTNDDIIKLLVKTGHDIKKLNLSKLWDSFSDTTWFNIIDRRGLFIAAPSSHFNLDKLKSDGSYGYFNITEQKREIKDPIVFRYCKGGIQVITKWGLEGKDETLYNEQEN